MTNNNQKPTNQCKVMNFHYRK